MNKVSSSTHVRIVPKYSAGTGENVLDSQSTERRDLISHTNILEETNRISRDTTAREIGKSESTSGNQGDLLQLLKPDTQQKLEANSSDSPNKDSPEPPLSSPKKKPSQTASILKNKFVNILLKHKAEGGTDGSSGNDNKLPRRCEIDESHQWERRQIN